MADFLGGPPSNLSKNGHFFAALLVLLFLITFAVQEHRYFAFFDPSSVMSEIRLFTFRILHLALDLRLSATEYRI